MTYPLTFILLAIAPKLRSYPSTFTIDKNRDKNLKKPIKNYDAKSFENSGFRIGSANRLFSQNQDNFHGVSARVISF
jgi:hypothetical protein